MIQFTQILKMWSIIIIALIFHVELLGQITKKTPDDLDGFRDFKLYSPITNYPNYNYNLVKNEGKYSTYEIVLPSGEENFLETKIEKLVIKQYKDKIISITLILKDDVRGIVGTLFKDTHKKDDNSFYRSLFFDDRHRFHLEEYHKEYKSPSVYSKWFDPDFSFAGDINNIEYGEIYYTKEKSILIDKSKPRISQPSYGDKYERITTIINRYYFRISSRDYKSKIDTELTKEHVDTYMSDFGINNHTKENNTKSVYKIPLFEINNTYYVRIKIGDMIESFTLDTGADQVIIGKSLYYRLKRNDLLTDLGISKKMILANGQHIELNKVFINNIQINDLKVVNVEAFVNTSDDISLLGQSFLKRFRNISVDHKIKILTIIK